MSENYSAQAVECDSCGHLDAHLVHLCPVCGGPTHHVVNLGEALLPLAVRRDIEIVYIKDDLEFDRVGNIAALLRYRSAPNSAEEPPVASPIKHSLRPPRTA